MSKVINQPMPASRDIPEEESYLERLKRTDEGVSTANERAARAEDKAARVESDLIYHEGRTDNPHSVSREQIGAAAAADLNAHITNTSNPHNVTAAQVDAPTTADFNAHVNNTSNPHSVTAAQAGAVAARAGVNNMWAQSTEPTGESVDDLWFNTKDYKWYYWDGFKWCVSDITYPKMLVACQPSRLYELDPITFAEIRNFAPSGTLNIRGIGGIENRLYYCDAGDDKIYEVNIHSLASINFTETSSPYLTGIGGTKFRLYACDNELDRFYELDPDTLSIIIEVASVAGNSYGIGGIEHRLYAVDATNLSERLDELNPYHLGTIAYRTTTNLPSGIGGTSDRLYNVDYELDEIFYRNPSNMVAIERKVLPYAFLTGVGGVK